MNLTDSRVPKVGLTERSNVIFCGRISPVAHLPERAESLTAIGRQASYQARSSVSACLKRTASVCASLPSILAAISG